MAATNTATVTEETESLRYAVVGFRWDEVFPELVVAYRDEDSLRESITAPGIVGIGFCSREAVPVIPGWLSTGRSSEDANSKNVGSVAGAAWQHALAAAVLIFYSRSLLGAAIRACVGA